MFLAQYKILRENGHSPSEAFNDTPVPLPAHRCPRGSHRSYSHQQNSLITRSSPLSQDGLHVQRMLDRRAPRRARLGPPYSRRSTARSLRSSSRACVTAQRRARYSISRRSTYREDLARELKEIDEQEIGRVDKMVRSLRPDYNP